MHILAISGSLRQGSYNAALLRAAADLLPPGVALTVYDHLEQIPAFNEDRVGQHSEAVDRLWENRPHDGLPPGRGHPRPADLP